PRAGGNPYATNGTGGFDVFSAYDNHPAVVQLSGFSVKDARRPEGIRLRRGRLGESNTSHKKAQKAQKTQKEFLCFLCLFVASYLFTHTFTSRFHTPSSSDTDNYVPILGSARSVKYSSCFLLISSQ